MPANTKISEIMTKELITVSINETVNKADMLMKENNIRHIPVIEGTKFAGLITERSLIEYSLKKIYDYDDEFGDEGHNYITDFVNIMNRDAQLIYPEDSVRKAVELMLKKKIDCLPVVDWDKNLVGIVTILDLLLFLNNKLS